MRYVQMLFQFLILISMAGCNKDGGNSAVDSSGSCTSATISAYNRLVGRSVSTYSTRSELNSIKSDCASYKNLIGGQTCKAEKLSTGEITSITGTSVDPVCNSATQMLAWLDSGATQTGSSSSSNSSTSSICNSSEISAYNSALLETAVLSESSTLVSLDTAISACDSFKKTIGNRSCEASKNGVPFWISYSSHATACTKAQTLKAAALKEIEINKVVVSKAKEKIVFTMISGLIAEVPKDAIVIYQNGRAFLPEASVGINESLPYCLVSVKFNSFKIGTGRLTFSYVFLPAKDNLVALALKSELDANEENSINCLPAKGKSAEEITVGELKTIFSSYAKIELVK